MPAGTSYPQRPTHLWVQPGSANEILVERTVYGESLTNPEALNHRGKVHQHYDGAGVVTSVAHDFKGNLLESRRRLATDYRSQVDWSALAALTDPAAITAAAEAMRRRTAARSGPGTTRPGCSNGWMFGCAARPWRSPRRRAGARVRHVWRRSPWAVGAAQRHERESQEAEWARPASAFE